MTSHKLHIIEGSKVMAANKILPVLLLTALKDQFLVCPDVARCSTAKDNIPHLPNPPIFCNLSLSLSLSLSDAEKDQCLL